MGFPRRAHRPRYDPPRLTPAGVHCLACGYDLRGLPGDPARCPECGEFTSAAEFFVRFRFRQREVQRLVSRSLACSGALLLALMCAAALWWTPLAGTLGLACAAGAWAWGIAGLRRGVGRAPRWLVVCGVHQALFVAAVLLAVLLSVLGVAVAANVHGAASRLPAIARWGVEIFAGGVATLAIIGSFGLALGLAIRWQERAMDRLKVRAMLHARR